MPACPSAGKAASLSDSPYEGGITESGSRLALEHNQLVPSCGIHTLARSIPCLEASGLSLGPFLPVTLFIASVLPKVILCILSLLISVCSPKM